jgi:hypothetical protein
LNPWGPPTPISPALKSGCLRHIAPGNDAPKPPAANALEGQNRVSGGKDARSARGHSMKGRAALKEDEVQGDQEGRLHGDDGNADGNRMAPRHAGQFHDAPL